MSSDKTIDGYKIGGTLGVGGFSKVKLGTEISTNTKYALKLIPKKYFNTSTSGLRQVKREIEALSKLSHTNILNLIHVNYEAKYPKADGSFADVMLLVLELAEGGELFDFLAFTGAFTEVISRTYFHQLISGLNHCHSMGIAHRDLKPENLLLNTDFSLKIADFGLAKVFKDENGIAHSMRTQCGTRGYMSPEQLAMRSYTESSDIFSAGVVLFIMVSGFPPFQYATRQDWWFEKIITKRHNLFWAAHERTMAYSPVFKDLINRMLCAESDSRITLEEIFDHPWVKGEVLSPDALKKELEKKFRKVQAERASDRVQMEKSKIQKKFDISEEMVQRDFDPTSEEFPNASPEFGSDIRFGEQSFFDSFDNEEKTVAEPAVYTAEDHVKSYTQFKSRESTSAIINALNALLTRIKCRFKQNNTKVRC